MTQRTESTPTGVDCNSSTVTPVSNSTLIYYRCVFPFCVFLLVSFARVSPSSLFRVYSRSRSHPRSTQVSQLEYTIMYLLISLTLHHRSLHLFTRSLFRVYSRSRSHPRSTQSHTLTHTIETPITLDDSLQLVSAPLATINH
jgi:hypothetical protein